MSKKEKGNYIKLGIILLGTILITLVVSNY